MDNDDRLKCELKRMGINQQYNHSKDLITKEEYGIIKMFNENENIVIRKADKSNTFVIMNKTDYEDKIDALISDTSKFVRIQKDPSDKLKTELNAEITRINSTNNDKAICKVSGHHEPGYIYGNPKTHKNVHDPPLRPIVSQIGTVTYQTAKWLNSIITKYMNKRYMIESTHEFITISKSIENPKMLAPLDVESLFTNIPVNETIDIIIHEVYNHPDIAPPNMPKESLKNLLYICTTKTPFKSPKGHLY